MSRSDNTVKDFHQAIEPQQFDTLGAIRRMAIGLTDEVFWQLIGVLLLDQVTREAVSAEIFSGIGFYARPAKGSNAEAVRVNAGGAENPLIVATRDEGLRNKMVGDAPYDSTAMFNSQAGVYIQDGKVMAMVPGGAPVELAKVSELNNLRAFTMQQFSGAGHSHAAPGGATTTTVPIVAPVPAPTTNYLGTDILRGQ